MSMKTNDRCGKLVNLADVGLRFGVRLRNCRLFLCNSGRKGAVPRRQLCSRTQI
jgi:hypothetical protein